MDVFVWDPLHQFVESHGFDRFPCKFHGFECPEDRETAPVSETGQYRLRFVNDIGDPYALASPRLICHSCVSRKKAIATRLSQRGVPGDEKKALQQTEREKLTPYFTAISLGIPSRPGPILCNAAGSLQEPPYWEFRCCEARRQLRTLRREYVLSKVR